MKKIWVGTNWKMTKTTSEGVEYVKELKEFASQLKSHIELFIIPSFPSLADIKREIGDASIKIGAQNMHWADTGAYTGEISPKMLQEIGINLVELGHSERRQFYNETDNDINKKVQSAIKYGMQPLICIGESLEQKNNGISKETLAAQLKVCLRDIPEKQLAQVLIAYEPVWAIGENGIPADAEYVGEIHQYIRKVLNSMYPEKGREIPLLFGGSVNLKNFLSYINQDEVNGLFVGRTAWNISTFKILLSQLNQ